METAKMKSIQLRNGLWLVGEGERLTVSRDKFGTELIGHIVQGDDALWRIDGRKDEFNTAESAATELVRSLTGRPI
jgi:hypothetical protein